MGISKSSIAVKLLDAEAIIWSAKRQNFSWIFAARSLENIFQVNSTKIYENEIQSLWREIKRRILQLFHFVENVFCRYFPERYFPGLANFVHQIFTFTSPQFVWQKKAFKASTSKLDSTKKSSNWRQFLRDVTRVNTHFLIHGSR